MGFWIRAVVGVLWVISFGCACLDKIFEVERSRLVVMRRLEWMRRRRCWGMRKFKGWEDGLWVEGILDLLDLL